MADNKPPLLQRLEQVDQRAVTAVEELVRGFHRTISDRLRESSDEMVRLVEGLTPELPRSFFTSTDFSDATAESDRAADDRPVDQVLDAAARIDSETTQGGILTALLDEARRFASRTAFFLTREGEALGWADRGFGRDGSLEGVRLRLEEISFWSNLSAGTAKLGSDDCAAFCRQLGVAPSRRGIMIPFVLRGQLGGSLYADRHDDEEPLGVASLQLLTHLAAQALETAALRGDGPSPTLRRIPDSEDREEEDREEEDRAETTAPTAEAPSSDAAVSASAAAGAAALGAVAEPETEADRAEEPEAAEPEAAEPEAAEPEAAEPEEAVAFEEAEEVVAEPIDEAELEALAAEPDAATEPGVGFEMVSPAAESEEEPEVDQFREPSAVDDIPIESVSEPELEDTGDIWALQEEEEAEEAEEDEPTEVWPASEPEDESPARDAAVGQETVRLDVAAMRDKESGPATVEPPPSEAITAELPQWDSGSPPPSVEVDESPTVVSARGDAGTETAEPGVSPMSGGYVPPAPEETAAEPDAADSGAETSGSTQVLPPTDLQGPGLAFTGASADADADEALREEARRLARLLVSEIKLYNEEIIEKGRRSGNIYERLKDDIDRSRQMYEERIDSRILHGEEDYFRQELVQRLAGGNEALLGDA